MLRLLLFFGLSLPTNADHRGAGEEAAANSGALAEVGDLGEGGAITELGGALN